MSWPGARMVVYVLARLDDVFFGDANGAALHERGGGYGLAIGIGQGLAVVLAGAA